MNLEKQLIYLQVGYILEIISTYAAHQCDPSKRSLSFISQQQPYFYSFWRRLAFLGPFNIILSMFTHELWAHAHVVGVMLHCEDVRTVLGNAMQTYQKGVLGIKKVDHIEKIIADEDWTRLGDALVSQDEADQIRSRRRDRELKEAYENAKAADKVQAGLL